MLAGLEVPKIICYRFHEVMALRALMRAVPSHHENGDKLKATRAIDGFTNFMHTILATKVASDNLKACPRFVWCSNN